MKNIITSIFILMITSNVLYAQLEGTLTKTNVRIGNCMCNEITVKYKISTLMGEPTVNGSFKVEGDYGCTLPYSTIIWLKISNRNGGYGYIKLDPTLPKINEGYGFNVTGSPDWDRFICGYNNTKAVECMSAESAKNLYRNGSIVSFEIAW